MFLTLSLPRPLTENHISVLREETFDKKIPFEKPIEFSINFARLSSPSLKFSNTVYFVKAQRWLRFLLKELRHGL